MIWKFWKRGGDRRTLAQRIHDSEVKWDCYMRIHTWGRSDSMDKDSVLWFAVQKAASHEMLLRRDAEQ